MDEYSTESIQRLVDEQRIASASELQRALNLNVLLRTVQRKFRIGRVGDALRRLAPIPHRFRQLGTSRQVNPLTYYAPHFGYNVYVDQNEKLVDFGCVIVAAVDGASCFVVDFIVMPHKNAVTIYSDLYVPMTRQYGLFECLVSDHGREFALVQFIQAELAINQIYEDGTAST